MKFTFSTLYTEEELQFVKENNVEIISEINLSRVVFSEVLLRMVKYGKSYFAEIEEDGEKCWYVLEKWRGDYKLGGGYCDFQTIVDNL